MLVDIAEAIRFLQAEEVVAFPTETVYGLGAIAKSETACQKIFATKGRPNINPLIIHVSSLEQAKELAIFDERALKIARELWPGPLTLVLKSASNQLAPCVTAGLETVGIRFPANEIAQTLIEQVGPLAAPSANISGRLSPTTADHVNKQFAGTIPVIDGGLASYGLESTIIDLSGEKAVILRYGFIGEETLSAILGEEVKYQHSYDAIKAPGMLKNHYAPTCALRINADQAEKDELVLNFGGSNLNGARSYNLSPNGDLVEAASNLYKMLHFAEDVVRLHSLKAIAVAPIPAKGIGLAINDKLTRAAGA